MSRLAARVDALNGRNAIPAAELRAIAADILAAAGIRDAEAIRAAEILCDAQLRGIDSHGLTHLPVYVRRLMEGTIAAKAVSQRIIADGAAVVIDAQNGLGVLAARMAIEEAASLAKQFGIGACAVRNSSHFGAASYFVSWAARQNLVALAFSNASPTMAPWGGKKAVLGTNPLAAAFPRPNGDPVVIDMATSAVARARIRAAKTKGETIPEHWALDEHGARTSDPDAALRGTVQPLGGEKGYALTLVIELLCSALAGGRPGFEVISLQDEARQPAGVSHLFIVLDPKHFSGTDRFLQVVEAVATEIESCEPSADAKPRLPGQRAASELKRRLADGIPATQSLIDSLRRAVGYLGVATCDAPGA